MTVSLTLYDKVTVVTSTHLFFLFFVVYFLVSSSNITRNSTRPVEDDKSESSVGVLWEKLHDEVRFHLSLNTFSVLLINFCTKCVLFLHS